MDILPQCTCNAGNLCGGEPVQDLVLSEIETLAVLGAGGFGKVTLVRYKGESLYDSS